MFAALVVAAAVFGACHETQHDHGAAASAVPAGLNPVQNEMRLLLDAMRDTVTGIANGKVTTVPESLRKVHAAKEATAAALKAGSYKPPKIRTRSRASSSSTRPFTAISRNWSKRHPRTTSRAPVVRSDKRCPVARGVTSNSGSERAR